MNPAQANARADSTNPPALQDGSRSVAHKPSESEPAPLVSVVTIFCDAKKFIQEAIESVLAQTHKDWELLLVDDGSRDGSTQIARRYASQRPDKIRYLEHDTHQNLGMSASRNLGIKHARGEYIAFLDADDVWLPGKLEKQVALLRAQPTAAMVYGPTHEWFSWSGDRKDMRSDFVQDLGVTLNTLIEPPALVPLTLVNEARSPRTCSVLLRREAVRAIGGFVTEFRGLYEDQAFFTKLCLRYPVFVMSDSGDRHRQHDEGSGRLAVISGQYHTARQKYLDWVSDYVSEQRIADHRVLETLEWQRWRYRHRALYRARELLGVAAETASKIARKILPPPVRGWFWAKVRREEYHPPVGWVYWGNLRRLKPISPDFGSDRGLPVDRYYIERFIATHAMDISGHVLEIGDDTYTRRFGRSLVTQSDVLHVVAGNPKATIVADLTQAEQVPSDTFDCVIFVQTLQFIYDTRAALKTLHRILKPGGVLLATVPGISQLGRDEWRDHRCWSFTTKSVRRLFGEEFAAERVEVAAHGNVLAATAFLQGIAAGELRRGELDHHDADYEMLITVRAVKS